MEYKIEEFNPKEVPDDFWEGYFEFTETNFKYLHPGDPLPNREAIIQRQKADIPNLNYSRWLVYTPENKIIGWAGFATVAETSPEYEQNKHISEGNIVVLYTHYRKGIGTALLKIFVQEAQARNKTVIEIGTENDSGKAFLKKHGADLTIEGAENRLELEDVDWDLMQSWVDEGPKRAEGVTIESFYEVPEEILDEYCEMYTTCGNMAPQGDVEYRMNMNGKLRRENEQRWKEIGYINYTLISREKDGKISGLTEIFHDPRDGDRILQELTGVLPEFRGRGLGKWLKAEMILQIKENYSKAKKIITGNADVNAPMLSINERMGFKRHKGGQMYKFQVEELAKRLGI